jgi:hypothetical protein
MSDTYEPTVEELNAELAKSKLEMEAKMNALQEKLQSAQKVAEEKVAKKAEEERKAEEDRLKAEAEEKARAEAKAEAECQATEAWEKAEAEKKAEAKRKVQEAQEKTEAAEKWEEEVASKAERVRLANRKRLDWELIEFKERTEAEAKRKAKEKKKNQAGDRMMLATPADLLGLDRAWIVNAENAKIQEENFKPWARSSKAPATLTPKLKALVNLSRQVWNEEVIRKTGKWGRNGDVAVSYRFQSHSAFLTCLSPGCYVRHVREPQGALHIRISGGMFNMPTM